MFGGLFLGAQIDRADAVALTLKIVEVGLDTAGVGGDGCRPRRPTLSAPALRVRCARSRGSGPRLRPGGRRRPRHGRRGWRGPRGPPTRRPRRARSARSASALLVLGAAGQGVRRTLGAAGLGHGPSSTRRAARRVSSVSGAALALARSACALGARRGERVQALGGGLADGLAPVLAVGDQQLQAARAAIAVRGPRDRARRGSRRRPRGPGRRRRGPRPGRPARSSPCASSVAAAASAGGERLFVLREAPPRSGRSHRRGRRRGLPCAPLRGRSVPAPSARSSAFCSAAGLSRRAARRASSMPASLAEASVRAPARGLGLGRQDLRSALGLRPAGVFCSSRTAAGLRGASAREVKPSQRHRSPSFETSRHPGSRPACNASPSARSTSAVKASRGCESTAGALHQARSSGVAPFGQTGVSASRPSTPEGRGRGGTSAASRSSPKAAASAFS